MSFTCLCQWLHKLHISKAIIFSFAFFYLNIATVFCQLHTPKFNYLTVDEGLSHTDANDLVQDKQGYIWVATYFGLNRFDGYSIKKFYNSNVPLNNAYKNRVICLYPEENGSIWLGTEGGIQCFDSKIEKYIDYTTAGNKSQPTFWKLIKGEDSFIYGLTDGQFRYYAIKGEIIEEQHLDLPAGIRFFDMTADHSGNLYFATNKGLWGFNKNRVFKNIMIAGCPDLNLSRLYFNNNQDLLIASANQLLLTHKLTDRSKTITGTVSNLMVVKSYACPPGRPINGVREDLKGNYWINAVSSLLCVDSHLNFIREITNKSSSHSFNSSSITNIYIDRSQCLWLCTFGGGVNYCDLNEKKFYTFRNDPKVSNSISGNYIRSVFEDNEKNLWIGTKYNGLNRYNFKSGKLTFYNSSTSPVKLKHDDITALTQDNDHNLWIGSGNGIEILKATRDKLWNAPGIEKFPDYAIETLAKDYYGNIWFGNHMNRFGVIWKDQSNNFRVKYYGEGFFILSDTGKPELFVSSTQGLKRLLIDKEGNIIRTFDYQAGTGPQALSSNYTYPVCKQNDSAYWIGTIGGGLDRMILRSNNSYTIKTYTGSTGVFNDVESLEIDNSGNIWLGGNGLQCLNPATGKLIHYDKSDGLQGNSFKVGSSYKGADGRLFFGGINGLNYFYPNEIQASQIPAKPVLTDLLINNQKPNYGPPDSTGSTFPQILSYCPLLKLNYLQNNFTISFSAMHYANPLSCKYRYKLIGYDQDWKFTDGRTPTAAYSNLEYSNYQFVVEATNNDGTWSVERATLPITITPPWWKSVWAKIIYAALFFGALLWLYIYQARWYRLKRLLAIRAINEKKREEMHHQREELYQQQLQFFTNVSHEFRTPLTLILGPLEGLLNNNQNSTLNHSYQLMFRNVKRLINLINELMNFKKVADSAIKLHVQPLAIKEFCNNIYLEFQELAVRKNITYTIVDHTKTADAEQVTNFFDEQILEKILFNLLNNALKYTNEGGQVTLEIFFDRSEFTPSFTAEFHLLNKQHRAREYIYFLIADTGIGISKESISSIFDRYYKISKDHLGSGVGLALVKSLTQLHKGDISIYSERYSGTEILIALPWGKDNFNESEIITPGTDMSASQLEPLDISLMPAMPDKTESSQPHLPEKIAKHILLVDDNKDLRTFLRQALEKFYFIHEAEDGSSAIAIATSRIPDLIISDVMMPGMSGIELCKLVKETFETSHIPFVILSAKDALHSKIEGMESGADYYFAKPLSIDLLVLTVHNIFQQSQKLKLKYSKDYLTEATELVHSEKDKEFINKLLELIEQNIQNPDLDVEFLCNQLYISRTKLYQKIKSISDQSIGEFIKTIRLKKAIQIMTHEDTPLNDVAYRIGLQSPAYFSRVFKKEYGKSPTEFMQSLKRDFNPDHKTK